MGDMDRLSKMMADEVTLNTEELQAVVVDASMIAEKRGYACEGWDALYVLFADRFSWTPQQVRSLTVHELSMMLDSFFRD